VLPVDTATLLIHVCARRRAYRVTFATEDQALAWLGARSSTHAWEEVDGGSVPESWSRLLDYLYPLCEHGMSESLCEGPDHYMTAEQERAMGW
jgi:hypothetical protein